ncbi:MAG: HD-like signal output (HDOD) protein [Planctomycetota bacterium]|jgi:HD-like signal output (HDOD) protein
MTTQDFFDPTSIPESLRVPIAALFRGENLKLPILSASISKLLNTCNSETPDMVEIAKLVSTDQSLAAHVLRLSNSAAYAPVNELVTIDDAVRRLGIRAIGDMAIGHMVLNGLASREDPVLKDLWKHAAVAGLYAYRIGTALGLRGKASLMPGLMMDVGRPLALGLLADAEKLIGEEIEDETKYYLADLLHTELGARLVDEWSLPSEVGAAIRFHDCYQDAEEFTQTAQIAHLASVLTVWALEPEDMGEHNMMELQIVKDLDLSERDLSQLMANTEEVLMTAASFE